MTTQSRFERLFWLAGWAYDFSRFATVLLVVILIINYFFASVMVVRGTSMVPTYTDGNVQIINRLAYEVSTPQRNDVIALNFPGEPNQRFVKRVIGLPGETVTVADGKVFINGQRLIENYLASTIVTQPDLVKTLASNEYFVMGDNRFVSSDSRAWGPVPKSFIIGKVESRIASLPAKDAP